MPVERAGFLILGQNHQGTCGDDGLGLKKPFDVRLSTDPCTKPGVLLRQINSESASRVSGNGMSSQTFGDRAGTKSNWRGCRRQRVKADDPGFSAQSHVVRAL